jgi:hypothetical protein
VATPKTSKRSWAACGGDSRCAMLRLPDLWVATVAMTE